MNRYQIEVFSQGELIQLHTIEASDALTAINLIELEYGPSPKIEIATVQLESGKKEHLLVVADWHGYSFMARKIGD
ncbi:MAG: hypothetical protein U0401_22355 [Anaerolineae bacterium]